MLADTLLYALGSRGGRGRPRRLLARLGLTEQRRATLTVQVHANLPRVVLAAKLVDLAAVPAFLTAGLAGVGLQRFLAWVVPATVVRSGVLVGIGFLAGDRFSEHLTARPWLLAVGGLAFGGSLVVGRAVAVRLASAYRMNHAWRTPARTATAGGAPAVAQPARTRLPADRIAQAV